MADRRRLLVIEDDLDTRRLYVRTLESNDFEVIDFEDGDRALEYLKENPSPDMMLIDLNTPGMSTEDFISEMKVALDAPTFPIMVVSGREDIAQKTRELGIHVYLKKPCQMSEFLRAIRFNCPPL